MYLSMFLKKNERMFMTDFDQASWASSGLTNAAVESSRESKRTEGYLHQTAS